MLVLALIWVYREDLPDCSAGATDMRQGAIRLGDLQPFLAVANFRAGLGWFGSFFYADI